MRFFLILLSILSFSVNAATLRITPIDKKVLNNRDILEVNVVSDIDLNWSLLDQKQIGGIFFVLKIYSQTNNMAIAKVMALPSNNQKEALSMELGSEKFDIEVVGFEGNFSKESPMKDFIVLDSNYSFNKSNTLIYLLIFLVFLVCIYFGRKPILKIFHKRQQKKLLVLKQEKLKELLDHANDREGYENIYLIKKEINDFFEVDKKIFNEYVKTMNQIQYLPQWSDENFRLAKSSLEKLRNNLREKSGV